MRVKVIRDEGKYRAGQVLVLDKKLAYKLVQNGIAEITKDMTLTDYKVSHGNTRRQRTNHTR